MGTVVNSHERFEFQVNDLTKEIAKNVISDLNALQEIGDIDYLKVLSNGSETNFDNALDFDNFMVDVCYESESNSKWLEPYFKNFDAKYSQYITYKCLKYYDVAEDVTAFEFSNKFIGNVSYDKTKDDVSFINEWYTNNFSLSIENADSVLENETLKKELYGLLNIIAEKYCVTDECIEDVENGYRLYDALTVKTDSIDELICDIQKVIDFAKTHNCAVEYYANFVPFKDYVNFAAISTALDNGVVNFKYALFND